MKKDIFYIKDIKNSLEKIFKYTNDICFEDFIHDDKTRDAVERNFEIIGEAVKKLSEVLKNKHPKIPFKQIAGMRDKLIHDYFGIDYEIIWYTIQNKLPEFADEIDNIIKDIN